MQRTFKKMLDDVEYQQIHLALSSKDVFPSPGLVSAVVRIFHLKMVKRVPTPPEWKRKVYNQQNRTEEQTKQINTIGQID